MAHGYLGDGYGSHGDVDPDREDDRERSWRDRNRSSMFGDWDRARSDNDRSGQQRYSAHPDDHYRSWRDRQISQLDRDYQEYCREREQQFHRDFDNWRQNRGQSGSDADKNDAVTAEAGELELTQERALAGEETAPSPLDAATLGTNNSENATTGRGGKQR